MKIRQGIVDKGIIDDSPKEKATINGLFKISVVAPGRIELPTQGISVVSCTF